MITWVNKGLTMVAEEKQVEEEIKVEKEIKLEEEIKVKEEIKEDFKTIYKFKKYNIYIYGELRASL